MHVKRMDIYRDRKTYKTGSKNMGDRHYTGVLQTTNNYIVCVVCVVWNTTTVNNININYVDNEWR